MLLVPLPALPEALISFLIIIGLCLPLHEFGHAWSAVKMGDTLPYYQGRVTLNPLRHIDWIGAGLLALAGFGWAKPVQVNPLGLRKAPSMRVGMLVVAMAGPLMNVLLAAAAALPFRLGLVPLRDIALGQPIALILYSLVTINLVLAVFNLIPVPPLDGSRILPVLVPAQYDNVLATLNQYGMFILLFLILPLFNGQSAVALIVMPIVSTLTRLFLGI
jgi:Zn-dependent protease